MSFKSFSIAVCLCLLLVSAALAEVPQMINYQGKITTPEGALIDTTISMTFAIYTDSIGTDSVWSETQSSVVVEKGIFSVLLGSVNPIPDSVFTGEIRYLGVKAGEDSEMTPRKAIVSVGYAFDSDMLDGKHADEFLRFIYHDSQYAGSNLDETWETVKSCIIPPNTVASHLIIYYDIRGFSLGNCQDSAQITVNEQPVDIIEIDRNFSFNRFRTVKIDVDNTSSLTITLDVKGDCSSERGNHSFLILGN